MPWNYGDMLDAVAAAVRPDAPAFMHGDRIIPWGDARRAHEQSGPGAGRARRQTRRQGRLLSAQCPEYTEAVGATFLGRFVHVNVNYRYKPEEVRYILDNSDARF